MYSHNTQFAATPFLYAQNRVISAMNMGVSNEDALKPGVMKTAFNWVFTLDYEYAASNQLAQERARILSKVNAKRTAKFDLEPSQYTGMDFFRACSPKDGAVQAEAPLRGYWCPYVPIGPQGNGLQNVPYAEFARNLPARLFVFTGAMNGCSIVITDEGNGMLRMYHDSTHNIGMFANLNVITSLGYDANSGCAHTYAHAGLAPTSFNFLYSNPANQSWHMVCQPQEALGPYRMGFNPNIAPFEVQI